MDVLKVEFGRRGGISVAYADGSEAEISRGRYEFEDASGITIERRAATTEDLDRLMAEASAFEAALVLPGAATVTSSEVERHEIEIHYADGSREKVDGGSYAYRSGDGLISLKRAATDADVTRLTDLASGAPATTDGDDGGSADDDGAPSAQKSTTDDVPRERPWATVVNLAATEGRDRLVGTETGETIDGLGGKDCILGMGGDDSISGGEGNDRLYGGDGTDVIDGGAGRDIYVGGAGADVFVFTPDAMLDKIDGFEDGVDLIDISAFGISDLNAVLAAAILARDNVRIDLGGGDIVYVDDVSIALITMDDFIF